MRIKSKLLFLLTLPLLALSACNEEGNTSTESQSTAESSSQTSSSQSSTSSDSSSSSSITTSESSDSSSAISSVPEKTNYEKALAVISNFNIENTNGYDYSLAQYLGTQVVNSDTIALRADFSSSPKGQKDETIRRLNEYGAGEQFSTTTTTTYFANNMIAEYKNNKWVWSNCKKSDYFKSAIANISFDQSMFTSVKENLTTSYVVTADVPDDKVGAFFNVQDTTINSLSVKLSIDSDFTKLESIELSYFQTATRSEMKFNVYYGPVSIDLPN